VLKVKLTTTIIGISWMHVSKTFIHAVDCSGKVLIAQTIHIALLFSDIAIAATDRIKVVPAESRDGRSNDH
jgi:uncharacterized membrane protein YqhA